jgi:hypothetical protein
MMRTRGVMAVVVAATALFATVAAVQTWARPFRRWRQKRAAHWPMTQARVESWNVAPVGGGEDGYYRGEIAYSYSVSDEFWPGFCAREFDTETGAWAFVDALKGKTVLVNYDPGNHALSVPTDTALRAAIPDPSMLRERRWWRFPLRPG